MAFTVTIKPSDHVFAMDANEPILEAALRETGGVLPYACRNGTCGTCMGRVLSGQVRYPGPTPPGIGAEEQAEGKALLCQAMPRSDLVVQVREIRRAPEVPVRVLPCRVVGMTRLAPDVMRLYLKLPSAERLQFLAGQYLSIMLRGGRRRDFSIANAPHADEYLEIHVRRVPGGEFSAHVFERMQEKAILRIEGPMGTFVLDEASKRPVIMIAGGTGFAPLKSMIQHAFHVGFGRPIHLYWGARARQDLYLHELPEAWMDKHASFDYTPVLSEPRAEDGWAGRTGLVHRAVAADYPDLGAHVVYMAGPPAMIQAGRRSFVQQGLPEERLYFDSFDYAADGPPNPGP